MMLLLAIVAFFLLLLIHLTITTTTSTTPRSVKRQEAAADVGVTDDEQELQQQRLLRIRWKTLHGSPCPQRRSRWGRRSSSALLSSCPSLRQGDDRFPSRSGAPPQPAATAGGIFFFAEAALVTITPSSTPLSCGGASLTIDGSYLFDDVTVSGCDNQGMTITVVSVRSFTITGSKVKSIELQQSVVDSFSVQIINSKLKTNAADALYFTGATMMGLNVVVDNSDIEGQNNFHAVNLLATIVSNTRFTLQGASKLKANAGNVMQYEGPLLGSANEVVLVGASEIDGDPSGGDAVNIRQGGQMALSVRGASKIDVKASVLWLAGSAVQCSLYVSGSGTQVKTKGVTFGTSQQILGDTYLRVTDSATIVSSSNAANAFLFAGSGFDGTLYVDITNAGSVTYPSGGVTIQGAVASWSRLLFNMEGTGSTYDIGTNSLGAHGISLDGSSGTLKDLIITVQTGSLMSATGGHNLHIGPTVSVQSLTMTVKDTSTVVTAISAGGTDPPAIGIYGGLTQAARVYARSGATMSGPAQLFRIYSSAVTIAGTIQVFVDGSTTNINYPTGDLIYTDAAIAGTTDFHFTDSVTANLNSILESTVASNSRVSVTVQGASRVLHTGTPIRLGLSTGLTCSILVQAGSWFKTDVASFVYANHADVISLVAMGGGTVLSSNGVSFNVVGDLRSSFEAQFLLDPPYSATVGVSLTSAGLLQQVATGGTAAASVRCTMNGNHKVTSSNGFVALGNGVQSLSISTDEYDQIVCANTMVKIDAAPVGGMDLIWVSRGSTLTATSAYVVSIVGDLRSATSVLVWSGSTVQGGTGVMKVNNIFRGGLANALFSIVLPGATITAAGANVFWCFAVTECAVGTISAESATLSSSGSTFLLDGPIVAPVTLNGRSLTHTSASGSLLFFGNIVTAASVELQLQSATIATSGASVVSVVGASSSAFTVTLEGASITTAQALIKYGQSCGSVSIVIRSATTLRVSGAGGSVVTMAGMTVGPLTLTADSSSVISTTGGLLASTGNLGPTSSAPASSIVLSGTSLTTASNAPLVSVAGSAYSLTLSLTKITTWSAANPNGGLLTASGTILNCNLLVVQCSGTIASGVDWVSVQAASGLVLDVNESTLSGGSDLLYVTGGNNIQSVTWRLMDSTWSGTGGLWNVNTAALLSSISMTLQRSTVTATNIVLMNGPAQLQSISLIISSVTMTSTVAFHVIEWRARTGAGFASSGISTVIEDTTISMVTTAPVSQGRLYWLAGTSPGGSTISGASLTVLRSSFTVTVDATSALANLITVSGLIQGVGGSQSAPSIDLVIRQCAVSFPAQAPAPFTAQPRLSLFSTVLSAGSVLTSLRFLVDDVVAGSPDVGVHSIVGATLTHSGANTISQLAISFDRFSTSSSFYPKVSTLPGNFAAVLGSSSTSITAATISLNCLFLPSAALPLVQFLGATNDVSVSLIGVRVDRSSTTGMPLVQFSQAGSLSGHVALVDCALRVPQLVAVAASTNIASITAECSQYGGYALLSTAFFTPSVRPFVTFPSTGCSGRSHGGSCWGPTPSQSASTTPTMTQTATLTESGGTPSLSGSPSREETYSRSSSSSLSADPSRSRSYTGPSLSSTESASDAASATRSQSDSVSGGTQSLSNAESFTRTYSSSLSSDTTLTRSGSNTVTGSASLSPSLSRSLTASFSQEDTATPSSSLSRPSPSSQPTVTDSLSLTSSLTRSPSPSQTLTESFSLQSSFTQSPSERHSRSGTPTSTSSLSFSNGVTVSWESPTLSSTGSSTTTPSVSPDGPTASLSFPQSQTVSDSRSGSASRSTSSSGTLSSSHSTAPSRSASLSDDPTDSPSREDSASVSMSSSPTAMSASPASTVSDSASDERTRSPASASFSNERTKSRSRSVSWTSSESISATPRTQTEEQSHSPSLSESLVVSPTFQTKSLSMSVVVSPTEGPKRHTFSSDGTMSFSLSPSASEWATQSATVAETRTKPGPSRSLTDVGSQTFTESVTISNPSLSNSSALSPSRRTVTDALTYSWSASDDGPTASVSGTPSLTASASEELTNTPRSGSLTSDVTFMKSASETVTTTVTTSVASLTLELSGGSETDQRSMTLSKDRSSSVSGSGPSRTEERSASASERITATRGMFNDTSQDGGGGGGGVVEVRPLSLSWSSPLTSSASRDESRSWSPSAGGASRSATVTISGPTQTLSDSHTDPTHTHTANDSTATAHFKSHSLTNPRSQTVTFSTSAQQSASLKSASDTATVTLSVVDTETVNDRNSGSSSETWTFTETLWRVSHTREASPTFTVSDSIDTRTAAMSLTLSRHDTPSLTLLATRSLVLTETVNPNPLQGAQLVPPLSRAEQLRRSGCLISTLQIIVPIFLVLLAWSVLEYSCCFRRRRVPSIGGGGVMVDAKLEAYRKQKRLLQAERATQYRIAQASGGFEIDEDLHDQLYGEAEGVEGGSKLYQKHHNTLGIEVEEEEWDVVEDGVYVAFLEYFELGHLFDSDVTTTTTSSRTADAEEVEGGGVGGAPSSSSPQERQEVEVDVESYQRRWVSFPRAFLAHHCYCAVFLPCARACVFLHLFELLLHLLVLWLGFVVLLLAFDWFASFGSSSAGGGGGGGLYAWDTVGPYHGAGLRVGLAAAASALATLVRFGVSAISWHVQAARRRRADKEEDEDGDNGFGGARESSKRNRKKQTKKTTKNMVHRFERSSSSSSSSEEEEEGTHHHQNNNNTDGPYFLSSSSAAAEEEGGGSITNHSSRHSAPLPPAPPPAAALEDLDIDLDDLIWSQHIPSAFSTAGDDLEEEDGGGVYFGDDGEHEGGGGPHRPATVGGARSDDVSRRHSSKQQQQRNTHSFKQPEEDDANAMLAELWDWEVDLDDDNDEAAVGNNNNKHSNNLQQDGAKSLSWDGGGSGWSPPSSSPSSSARHRRRPQVRRGTWASGEWQDDVDDRDEADEEDSPRPPPQQPTDNDGDHHPPPPLRQGPEEVKMVGARFPSSYPATAAALPLLPQTPYNRLWVVLGILMAAMVSFVCLFLALTEVAVRSQWGQQLLVTAAVQRAREVVLCEELTFYLFLCTLMDAFVFHVLLAYGRASHGPSLLVIVDDSTQLQQKQQSESGKDEEEVEEERRLYGLHVRPV